MSAMGRPSDARQRLLKTTTDLLLTHSYSSVSVDELCARAGVTKSSFYHFFSSKYDLALAALDTFGQTFRQQVLIPAFASDIPPQERPLRFFDLMYEIQWADWKATGHVNGCFAGNMTLEMSVQEAVIRASVERIFSSWQEAIEGALREAIDAGILPRQMNPILTAQSFLAYIEGAILLAKSRNDPHLIKRLREGARTLLHLETERTV
jgi:TetR/AcrR family transcriptional repressor of nem operon